MKKVSIFFTLVAACMLLPAALVFSDSAPVHESGAESVAISSSMSGGFVNPAVLSFGHGTGFGYIHNYDEDGFTEDFTLYLHSQFLGYGYSSVEDENYHTITVSFPLMDNLYFGTALTTSTFDDRTSSWNTGVLLRPTDYLSLGARATVPAQKDPVYTTGLALRPLEFALPQAGTRISIFADLPWTLEEVRLPKVGLHFEPINGVQARFGYDFEDEALGASFSIALSNINGGSSVRTDSSGSFQSGSTHLQSSPRPFNHPEAFGNELYYEYDLGPGVYEAPQGVSFGPFYLRIDEHTLLNKLNEIDAIAKEPSLHGLVFMNQHTQMSLSTMRELRDALLRLKESGKKIIFYSDYMSRVEYTLAAATADALYIQPQGIIDLRGFSASSPYFETFFKKYGIEVENFRIGDYKTAYNFLSEESMPPAERESLEYMLQGFFDELARIIQEGRGEKLNGSAAELIKSGPYFNAEKALSAGLIDGVLQKDELENELEKEMPFFTSNSTIKDSLPRKQVRRDWNTAPTTKVALIQSVGLIHTGEGQPGAGIGAETTAAAIRAAREDTQVKAILLRIHSGGGSAQASDIIAREVELCRTGSNAKPVIVSMGGAAASGGYYMSAFAESIVASPFTLTGSIGVIAIFPNIAGLLEKQEISWDVVKQSPQSDFAAMYRRLNQNEKEEITKFIEATYNRFIEVVSEGRDLSTEEVKERAAGRVWTGTQGKNRALVDTLGGYREALDIIAEKLGTSKELELVDYAYADSWMGITPGKRLSTALHQYSTRLQERADQRNLYTDFLPPEISRFYHEYRTSSQSGPEFSLLLMPYYVEDINMEKNH